MRVHTLVARFAAPSTLFLLASVFGATASGVTTIKVDPAGTWLKADTAIPRSIAPPDLAHEPTSVPLASLSVRAGEMLELREVGAAKWGDHMSDNNAQMIAVFRRGSTLVSPGKVQRPPQFVTQKTCPRHLPTDVPQDFRLPPRQWLAVQVPAEADNIAFSPPDCYWSDNTDPNGDYKVEIRKR